MRYIPQELETSVSKSETLMWLSAFWLALPSRQFSLVLWLLDRRHLALFFCQHVVLKFIAIESKSHPLPLTGLWQHFCCLQIQSTAEPSMPWESSPWIHSLQGQNSEDSLTSPGHSICDSLTPSLCSFKIHHTSPLPILCPTKAPSSSNLFYTWSQFFLKCYQSLCQKSISSMVS